MTFFRQKLTKIYGIFQTAQKPLSKRHRKPKKHTLGSTPGSIKPSGKNNSYSFLRI